MSYVKPKSKLSPWPITNDTDNMHQSKLEVHAHVADAKRGKTGMSKGVTGLVLVSILIKVIPW